MLGGAHQSVLDALRSHVSLDRGVSDELTAFHERERGALSQVLIDARDLAGRLEPKEESLHQSLFSLESWLGAVLHGPHDGRWFDERVSSPLRAWSDLPTLASVLIIGRVRQQLTEIATATSIDLDHAGQRIADALARLFDLELALKHFGSDVMSDAVAIGAEVDPLRALLGEVNLNVRNALGVIETSAYLVRRYSERVAPEHAKIAHHLGRISKHVNRTREEFARLVEAARRRNHPAN